MKILFSWMLSSDGKKYLSIGAALWVFAIYPLFACWSDAFTWTSYISASFIAFLYLLSGAVFWVLLYSIGKTTGEEKQ